MAQETELDERAGALADGRQDIAAGAAAGPPGEALSARQRRLLTELAREPDIQAAAQRAGVARSTVYRWLRDPVFQEQLTRQRDVVLTDALSTVKAHAAKAVEELGRLLGAADERLRRLACNDILGHALKAREMEDFERRLAALEKALENREGGRTAEEQG